MLLVGRSCRFALTKTAPPYRVAHIVVTWRIGSPINRTESAAPDASHRDRDGRAPPSVAVWALVHQKRRGTFRDSLICTTKATYSFSGLKTARFGRKSRVLTQLFTILFCLCAAFGNYLCWKPLRDRT